jgi:hypothetical protein
MRITRQKLVDLARRHAEQAANETDVLSAYLTGSVVQGDPLLGGSADIDLVLIHDVGPAQEREVVRLSADVHLDIAHHARRQYADPKSVRVDPWLGPAVSEPIFLYDPQHFFEWAQAGARGQYHRPDHVLARARSMLEAARTTAPQPGNGPAWAGSYLEAALQGANAAALLVGPPAWGRRSALLLEQRAAALNHPEVYAGFLRLHGADGDRGWELPGWLTAWARAFDRAGQTAPAAEFHPCRRTYFLSGFQALLDDGQPAAVIGPLLRSWDHLCLILDESDPSGDHRAAYIPALAALQLTSEHRAARADELEAYLDHIESVLETWAERTGA